MLKINPPYHPFFPYDYLYDEAFYAARQAVISSSSVGGGELKHIAAICHAMPKLVEKWNSLLNKNNQKQNLKIDVSSVFIDKSPIVSFQSQITSSQKNCELADLLIAVVDKSGGKNEARAVLIQAKMQSNTSLVSSKPNSNQLEYELLSTRPDFFIVDGSKPRKRIFPPPVIPGLKFGYNAVNDTAFQYGIIDDKNHDTWMNEFDLYQKIPPPTVGGTVDLSCILTNLFLGWGMGWNFQPSKNYHNNGTDDWSDLINYLLNVTYGRLSNSMANTSNKGQRGNTTTIMFSQPNQKSIMASNFPLNFSFDDKSEEDKYLRFMGRKSDGGDNKYISDDIFIKGSNGAISTILIEIADERS